jgi:hypothetical protein
MRATIIIALAVILCGCHTDEPQAKAKPGTIAPVMAYVDGGNTAVIVAYSGTTEATATISAGDLNAGTFVHHFILFLEGSRNAERTYVLPGVHSEVSFISEGKTQVLLVAPSSGG